MSNIKLFTFNLAVQDRTDITATSENSLFPISNIKDPRTTKVTRSANGVTSNAYVFDIKTTEIVNSVLMVPDSRRGSLGIAGDVTIKANFIDGAWGTAPFSTTLTPNETFDFGFVSFANKEYRFWQISFTNTGDFTEMSKIFIGQSVSLTNNNIDFGWSYNDSDNSKFRTNRYKQKFSDKINRQKIIRAQFNLLNKDEFDTIVNAFDDVETTEPLWIIVDSEGLIINDFERFAGYFYLRGIPNIINGAFSLYDLPFLIEQAT